MKSLRITLLLFFFSLTANFISAQTTIKGIVVDDQNEAIIGANIFLVGTYDGTSSDIDGTFIFESFEEGSHELVISYLGFEDKRQTIELKGISINLSIELTPTLNELEMVVISAGAFEASDEKKAVMLRSLDIVTTAGATADIAGALNTLPGTQKVGEEGQLFVRGGAAHETQTFIDGLLVQNPYSSSVPSIPARGRFSPFLFKGTTFSTGGYSAEYGQALSSALILDTEDLAPKTVTGISLMSVGLGLAHTQRWDSTSISASIDYTNLAPYAAMVPQNIQWEKPFQGMGGQVIFRHKTSPTGILKIQASGNLNGMEMQYPDQENVLNTSRLSLDNENYYINTSYKEILGEKWTLFTGAIFAWNKDEIKERFQVTNQEQTLQFKSTLSYHFNDKIRIKSGIEYFNNDWQEEFANSESDLFATHLKDQYGAGFVESDIHFSKKMAARVGVRLEYDDLLQEFAASPRLSLAYKTGKNSQVSLAYGQFFQNPEKTNLRYHQNLGFERADHYILNYQILTEERTFRIEAYWKDYKNLLKFDAAQPWISNNDGNGYARGIDVFYRDKKSIKNGDFWLSYSFLDTERDYLDFPVASSPSFASKHNFSAVYKHWFNKLNSNLGLTYSFSSPRAFNDPNQATFNSGRTLAYHDLSMNWSYLTHWFGQFTIIHASITNVLGVKQEFGQRFSNQPNAEGQFTSIAVRPPAKRFIFVGLFISIK